MITFKGFRFTTSVLLISVALLFGGLPSTAQQPTPHANVTDLVKATVESVVLIETSKGEQNFLGSGFVASSDGRIVTNHHVIAGATSAVVKLNNGAKFSVEGLLADDPVHDLAVIKVSGKNLPVLTIANSDHISPGDHVVAIGSPLGFENSVSDGIVSAIRENEKGRQWIQTTAPASHGNSGGPLLTMAGEVVGIVTWKSPGENLNFAVPSNFISPLLANITIQPLGSTTTKSGSFETNEFADVWTSMTTGRDYKLRRQGDYVYAEWVNVPPALQSSAAFIRSELKKDGDRYLGKTRSYLPCEYKSSYSEYWTTGQRKGTANIKWCTTEFDSRIDKLSDGRIEGVTQSPSLFDCRKCQALKLEWKPFVWIPK